MATFKEVREMTLFRVDEYVEDVDMYVKNVIDNAINQAYMLISSKADPKVKDVTVPYSKRIDLPEDIIAIENVSHSEIGDLSPTDYEQRANVLYLRSKDVLGGSVTITYTYFPLPLKDDTDTVELNHGYIYALAAYGAYSYQLYRRKYSSAQLLLSEFNLVIGENTQYVNVPEGESNP